MKNRQQRQIIFLLLLVLLPSIAFFPVHAEGEIEVRELLSGIGQLVPVRQTPYLLAQEWEGSKWGVFNTDGELLVPYSYASLSYLSCNCFDAMESIPPKHNAANPAPLEEINSHALVTADGTRFSQYSYGVIQVFSTYWACGWVLEEGTEEDHDYEANAVYYRIQRCDLFYLGDHALLGKKGSESIPSGYSLMRDEFRDARGHGKYLSVQDRQDQITVYDSAFHQLDIEIKKLDEPMYTIRNKAVMPRCGTEIVVDGCSAVQEVSTDAGLLLKVTRLDYSGKKWYTVFSLDGKQLMPLISQEISTVTPDYAVLKENKKNGLYSVRENRLLAECAFDKIITNKNTLDPYLLHGYLCVEKEGMSYYLYVDDGELIPVPSLGKKWKKTGVASYLYDSANYRYRILTPDQTESDIHNAKIVKDQLRGSGYLLAFTSEIYGHMIANWYGKILIKFNFYSMIITDDDKIIAPTGNNGYKLLEIIENE